MQNVKLSKTQSQFTNEKNEKVDYMTFKISLEIAPNAFIEVEIKGRDKTSQQLLAQYVKADNEKETKQGA
ncbi:MAG: hypothetical protein R3Y32_03095 [Bacillota bacterium]